MRKLANLIVLAVIALTATVLPSSSRAEDAQPDRWQQKRNENWLWPSEKFAPNQQQRNEAGVFDYYALVMSWSPTYCADEGSSDGSQCNRRDGRRYAFILHGLWPQYEQGWPSECRLQRRPFVPDPVIDAMMDIMPSRGLIIHEYRKHGTCSGLTPDAFFTVSRRLFSAVKIPAAFVNPFESQVFTPAEIVAKFAEVNPQIPAQSIAVVCSGAGNRLREVRMCFDRTGKTRACGSNENQNKLCPTNRVMVPPVRSTARDGAPSTGANPNASGTPGSPLPRPRVID